MKISKEEAIFKISSDSGITTRASVIYFSYDIYFSKIVYNKDLFFFSNTFSEIFM